MNEIRTNNTHIASEAFPFPLSFAVSSSSSSSSLSNSNTSCNIFRRLLAASSSSPDPFSIAATGVALAPVNAAGNGRGSWPAALRFRFFASCSASKRSVRRSRLATSPTVVWPGCLRGFGKLAFSVTGYWVKRDVPELQFGLGGHVSRRVLSRASFHFLRLRRIPCWPEQQYLVPSLLQFFRPFTLPVCGRHRASGLGGELALLGG